MIEDKKNMIELSFEYWNQLANQLIMISSLLSGFSIAVTANLLVNKSDSTITNNILKVTTVSSGSFLLTVFAFTNIMMKTTQGYPMAVSESDLDLSRIIGFFAFTLGIISLSTVIALSGWTKSRRMGIFTTIVGVLTLLLILMTMS